jgi:hypothetical protein
MNIYCPHIQTMNDTVVEWVEKARPIGIKIVATHDRVDKIAEWYRAGWLKYLVLRGDGGDRDVNLGGDIDYQAIACAVDGADFARPFMDAGMTPIILVEGPNEKAVWNPAEIEAFSRYEAVRAERLASKGIRAVCFQFPVGHPDIALWKFAVTGMRRIKAVNGAMGLHQYSQPQYESAGDWTSWRHFKVYEQLPQDLQDMDLFITEAGIDGGTDYDNAPTPRPREGWKSYCDEAGFLAQLKTVMPRLQKAKAVFLFTFGNPEESWPSFETSKASSIAQWIGDKQSGDAIGDGDGGAPQPSPEGAPTIGQAGGGEVANYSADKVWGDFQGKYGPLPALLKARAEHPELGDAIERDAAGNPIERDYGKYRISFYAGGIAWAEINNWGNRGAATSKAQLPLA